MIQIRINILFSVFSLIILGRYTNLWHKMWVNLGLFSIFKRIKIVYLFRRIKNDSQNYGSSLECTLDTWAENSRCYRCTWAGVFNPRQFSKLNWITVKNLNWAKYYPAVHSKFIQISYPTKMIKKFSSIFYVWCHDLLI